MPLTRKSGIRRKVRHSVPWQVRPEECRSQFSRHQQERRGEPNVRIKFHRWTPPCGHELTVLPAGRWWDAVRATEPVGERALRLLGADSGAVIQDRYGPLYWLVRPGAADGWDVRDVRVLGLSTTTASYIGVPPGHRTTSPGTHWRIAVGPDRYLTDAARLRGALLAALGEEVGR
ncbi:hypothetical protein SSOG_02153 [Streptomyces himastatinicus ATCC 53653]|uniref:Uncharacterized protein n=1 Tax=Streptomyces himastatinicus ATCC 53653 TaxID=457427 RepID=D9W6B0_9ACTN|nr:hypothetical protein SSOG_02153 [Streptomyces himastatinicus ATCC 53653]